MASVEEDKYERLMDLAKRRGFLWPSYEIYGGVAGFYDLGPYGISLKNNIINKWREYFIRRHQDMVVEVETPVIGPAKVYEASGHVENFTDPIVECLKCGRKFRADHLVEEKLGISVEGLTPEELTKLIRENNIKCPVCGGELGEVKTFNLLFETRIGPYESNKGYIRPELAQGIFVAFKRVLEAMRNRLPLGIAQIGRVGRNEISPRQGVIRLREFTIMEMEFFIDPKREECPILSKVEDVDLYILTQKARLNGEPPEKYKAGEAVDEGIIVHGCLAYWMVVGKKFVESLGIPGDSIMFEDKLPDERAHYSSQTFDQKVKVSRWGWIEIAGHSYRGDYDLSRHMKYSGKDLRVYRSYPEPVIRKTVKYLVNKALIGRMYKKDAPNVISIIEKYGVEKLYNELADKEAIVIDGYRITKDMIIMKIAEEKITGEKFVPHVIEPSFGTDRIVFATLEHAYREKDGRRILSFPRDIAPVQVSVFPLIEKDEKLREIATSLYRDLVDKGFTAIYDDSGNIGRRYARSDEIGVPFAVTVDYQTLEDKTVTVRDRDTWRQVRVNINRLPNLIRIGLGSKLPLEELVSKI
ncbi:MAG: glycine--tRNA ligase [Desulfurococcales archaeon]|nr:glycine--tRNA ligase [Desulfurococcales archaeon]